MLGYFSDWFSSTSTFLQLYRVYESLYEEETNLNSIRLDNLERERERGEIRLAQVEHDNSEREKVNLRQLKREEIDSF